jgi:hypothetical protein
MGSIDRVTRAILAVVIGVLYFTGVIPGTLGLVLFIVAIVFLITSLISFCPLYAVLGVKTCRS